jgi:hypothetical protein
VPEIQHCIAALVKTDPPWVSEYKDAKPWKDIVQRAFLKTIVADGEKLVQKKARPVLASCC